MGSLESKEVSSRKSLNVLLRWWSEEGKVRSQGEDCSAQGRRYSASGGGKREPMTLEVQQYAGKTQESLGSKP